LSRQLIVEELKEEQIHLAVYTLARSTSAWMGKITKGRREEPDNRWE
jgi:hypothetical protein